MLTHAARVGAPQGKRTATIITQSETCCVATLHFRELMRANREQPMLGRKLMCIFSQTAFDRVQRERAKAAKLEWVNALQEVH